MLRKWNGVLSLVLAIAIVFTTLGSDFTSTRAYAVESEEEIGLLEEQEVQEEQVSEEFSETEETGDVVEESEETNDQTEDTVEEEVAEADSEEVTEDATEETTEEVTDEAAEEDSIEEAATEADSEEVTEEATEETTEDVSQKLVTVSYKATKGGHVSNNKETVDINDKEAKFEGTTASAWNDEYSFVDWTDSEGNQVSTEATFVPSDVEADTVFTANFVAVENISEVMPAIEASNVHEGGMVVSVKAEEGLFPAGTEVKIRAISDGEALAAAQDTLGAQITVAKGVDISFEYEGNDVQPADNRYVHVTLDLDEAIEAENISVLHDHDGNVEEISASVSKDSEGNADAVSFDSNQFSIFIVAGEGEDDQEDNRELATYNFYKKAYGEAGNEVMFSKKVKEGDVVSNPGAPTIGENQEFLGWYVYKDGVKTETSISATEDSFTVGAVKSDEVVDVYPVFSTVYFVTFFGFDGEIWRVDQVNVAEEGDEYYSFDDDAHKLEAEAGKVFRGWSTSKASENLVTKVNVKEDSLFLYACVAPAYWVRFNGNGNGADFTNPVFVEKNENLSSALSKVEKNPERPGYEFKGWSLTKGEDNEVITAEDLNTKIQNVSTVDNNKMELTLYAVWEANAESEFTVVVWYQNVNGDGYDYAYSDKVTGIKTGSIIVTYEIDGVRIYTCDSPAIRWSKKNTQKGIRGQNNEIVTGFEYNESRGSYCEIKDGKGNITDVVSPAGDTIVNVYVQRREITATFMLSTDKGWEEYAKYTRLYGQKFEGEYRWPSEYVWRENRTATHAIGTIVCFLEGFIENETLYANNEEGYTYKAYHYKQDVNGNYNLDDPSNVSEITAGGWNFSNKYAAFNVVKYFDGEELTNTNVDEWADCHDFRDKEGKGISHIDGMKHKNLYVLHERQKFDLTLKVIDPVKGNITESSVKEIPYEKVLSTDTRVGADGQNLTAPEKAGYVFGWYKSPEGQEGTEFDFDMQMPDGGVVVYGVYKPSKFTVTLHSEGGEYQNQLTPEYGVEVNGEIAQFSVRSDELVERSNLISGVKKNGYGLVEWFYEDGTKFDYNKLLDSDVDLYAHWREASVVKIVYKAQEEMGAFADGSAEFVTEFDYSKKTDAVIAAPPVAKEGFVFVGYNVVGYGKDRFYPNDTFAINAEVLEANTETRTIDGKEYQCIVVNALFKDITGEGGEDEITTIIYDPNNGDEGQSQVVEKADLEVNEKVKSKGAIFKKAGYTQVSWNTQPDGSGLTVPLSKEFIAADNTERTKNSKVNVLYAIYKKDSTPKPVPEVTPTPDPVIPVTPSTDDSSSEVPTAATEALIPVVLGAKRDQTDSLPAVLGARRAATEDTTRNASRVVAIILAAAAAATLLLTGKKKDED